MRLSLILTTEVPLPFGCLTLFASRYFSRTEKASEVYIEGLVLFLFLAIIAAAGTTERWKTLW
jgi:hypothetical protein